MRDQATWVGTATINPESPVVAGDLCTWGDTDRVLLDGDLAWSSPHFITVR